MIISCVIKNRSGFHSRPINCLKKVGRETGCEILIQKGDKIVSIDSFMQLLLLQGNKGETLTIHITGLKEEEAGNQIKQLFDNKFNEEF
jgi:phosphotransferase system HPr (HPr) family protein